MDKAKEVAKHGWHPKGKDGGKESWRGDFKGINSVATKFGKGKQTSHFDNAVNHNSRPLASLKDPDSFGPPPKNVNYHGGAAVPNSVTPDRRGLGAPLTSAEVQHDQQRSIQEDAAQNKPAPPPVPFRANRTGINTQNLPKPPVRSVVPGAGSPVSATSTSKPPKPNPPPRLPPRQNSNPLQTTPDPPPPYSATAEPHQSASPTSTQNEIVNRSAINRLGAAGVNVPGFGIGRNASQANNTDSSSPAARNSSPGNTPSSSISTLQSRFTNMSTNSSPASPPAQTPTASGGTTFAQKQAAFKTASAFQKDPSSVSLADAKATASTANNFRERHGEQVAQGWKVGQGLNSKYGIADKLNTAANAQTNSSTPPAPPSATVPTSPSVVSPTSTGSGINRKPPPPPVPMGSKPR